MSMGSVKKNNLKINILLTILGNVHINLRLVIVILTVVNKFGKRPSIVFWEINKRYILVTIIQNHITGLTVCDFVLKLFKKNQQFLIPETDYITYQLVTERF